jgi:diguanylate cyclase (GGDEF)-like protein
MILRILLALACAAGIARAHAQVELTGRTEAIDLWPHVQLLSDPARTLTLEQAIAARERFAPPRGAYATLGMQKEVAWLRIPYQVGPAGAGMWIFEIDYSLLQRIDLYVLREGRVVHKAAMGNSLPFAERPIRGRNHAAAIELPADHAGEILLRIDTPGARIVPLWMSRISAFHADAMLEQVLQGALGGLGVFLLIFSLVQWYHLRESLYLKYALLVACSTVFSLHFFGIGEMYLWKDLEWVDQHFAGITSMLAAAATALFVEEALAGELNRWLRRGLRAVAVVQVLGTLAYAIDLIDIRAVAIFMTTTGLAPALMGLPGAIARARRGDSVGTWFIVAWLGYFVASAILVGVVRGRLDATFWTLHSFQFGATVDMLIFMRIALLRTAARHRAAQRAAQERDALFSLAHSDPLTGLLNRRGLADELDAALERSSPEKLLALYVLDLDGFKPVNDQHGHDVGDALLRAVAQRLRASVRAADSVARFGGDEFVIMAEGLPDEVQARELGQKLLGAFATPFSVAARTCAVRATIGYSLAPADGRDATALLKVADAAMYEGKQAGKHRVQRGSRNAAMSPSGDEEPVAP